MPLKSLITSDIYFTDEERDFIIAMEYYQSSNHRRYPTLREILAVLKSLGYRKTEPQEPLPSFCRKGGRLPKIHQV